MCVCTCALIIIIVCVCVCACAGRERGGEGPTMQKKKTNKLQKLTLLDENHKFVLCDPLYLLCQRHSFCNQHAGIYNL